MTYKEFREFRISLGMSQAQIAEKLGVGLRAVQGWEQRQRKIPGTVDLLMKKLKPNKKPTHQFKWRNN